MYISFIFTIIILLLKLKIQLTNYKHLFDKNLYHYLSGQN